MRRLLRMKRTVVALTAMLAAGATAAVAFGASPHFEHGSTITCNVTSGTNTATDTCTAVGGLSGLGNADVAFVLGGSGSVSFDCQNPGNGNVVPGQNKIPFTTPPTTIVVSADSIKNGNLTFFGPSGNTMSDSESAPSETATQVGCPNSNWETRPTAVFFTSIDLQIQQPPGTTIFDCTASNPNGLTGTVTLSCTKV
jgi:hypothetical protein